MAASGSAPRSPDLVGIQRLAATVMKAEVAGIEELDGYLHKTYQLTGMGGSFCLMKCSPSDNLRLLTCEEDRLGVEASVLALLGRRVDIAAPKLLEYQASTASIGSSYIISGPYSGSVMSFGRRVSSASERIHVDRSLGTYIQRLAAITHRSFGPFRRPTTTSWATYFGSLLEAVLLDAENARITLPYATIRQMLLKHRGSLDDVDQAKLVLLEVASTDNLVIDAQTHDVTSLVDYSTAFWGDPFLSDAFHRPSRSFIEGYGEGIDGDNDKRLRHLLYELPVAVVVPEVSADHRDSYISYHSLLAIVRQRLRPQAESREDEAERALLIAIRYLNEIPT